MDYELEMEKLLKVHMTTNGYMFWEGLKKKIEPVWDRPTSSTKKHHRKEDGRVPNIAEHTFEMLYGCIKVFSLFGIESNTTNADVLLFAIILHDAHKYGEKPDSRQHTDRNHDQITANKIRNVREIFLKFLDEDQTNILEETVRYHSGKWSPEAPKNFDFANYHPYTFFVHMLDMMSSRNLIKIITQNGAGQKQNDT